MQVQAKPTFLRAQMHPSTPGQKTFAGFPRGSVADCPELARSPSSDMVSPRPAVPT